LKAIGVTMALHCLFGTKLIASTGCDKASPSSLFAANSVTSATPLSTDSYRLEFVRRDPLLGETWGIFSSCFHPEQPRHILRLPSSDAMSNNIRAASVLIVHAGDMLELRSGEQNVAMQLVAIAEEAGAVGQRVRVHLLRPKGVPPAESRIDTGWGMKLSAIVLGPHEAEVRP
jgi:hypothetical protein